MNYIYLISIIIGVSMQNVFKKSFTQKTNGGGYYFFGALSSLAAMLFFVITSKEFEWNGGFIPYSVGFAVSYGAATVFSTAAVSCGSLSISSLVIAYSLMLPTLYGLVFLNDPISIGLIPGLVLLAVSLLLINAKNDKAPITFKWVVYVLLAFLGNGLCSVVQKMQQVKFDGAYKNEFMIIALAIVALLTFVISLVTEFKKDGKTVSSAVMKGYVKCGLVLALLCGGANGLVNLFVMILSGLMPVSLMFPLISGGGIVLTYIISRLYYKEKLTKTQLIGFLCGTASVILLNI